MEKAIFILDFGSQYTQLIARRIREQGVFSEIYPFDYDLKEIFRNKPAGIILSGGPSSVLEDNAPLISAQIFENNIPLLGICYGMQLISKLFCGKVIASENREYGKEILKAVDRNSLLLDGVSENSVVWMSHGDSVKILPPEFKITALTRGGTIAAIEHKTRPIFGVQFHPEVVHTQEGEKILANFIFKICRAEKNWKMEDFIRQTQQDLQQKCRNRKVILGVSGGVDSTTLAKLAHSALGNNLHALFINTGLLRWKEEEEVLKILRLKLQLQVDYLDASADFISALRGVKNPEKKRRIIGELFVEKFFAHVQGCDFLIQGTLYPDLIESNSVKGPSATIKTHHNRVAQVIELEKEGRVIEPFRFLFKDEVRQVARILQIPPEVFNRHPFPGPGLAVRILGAVNQRKIRILQQADHIFISELKRQGFYESVWQAFAVLLPVKSVGVMGDCRSYGYVVALRAVTSVDGMTANWAELPLNFLEGISSRIVREIKEVNRVVYDITSKPPATIEWE